MTTSHNGQYHVGTVNKAYIPNLCSLAVTKRTCSLIIQAGTISSIWATTCDCGIWSLKIAYNVCSMGYRPIPCSMEWAFRNRFLSDKIMFTLVVEHSETELPDDPNPLEFSTCRNPHHPKSGLFNWHLSHTCFTTAYHVCNFQIETLCISRGFLLLLSL